MKKKIILNLLIIITLSILTGCNKRQYKGIEKEYTADTQTLEKKEIILNK